jgi:hypothetical protein
MMPIGFFSTIEVMYLSIKRSKDALLALGFFVMMALVMFSTMLYVHKLSDIMLADGISFRLKILC